MPANSENAATAACLTFDELIEELKSRCDTLVLAFKTLEHGEAVMGFRMCGPMIVKRGLIELMLKSSDADYREWLEDSDNNLDTDSEGAQD